MKDAGSKKLNVIYITENFKNVRRNAVTRVS